jgi:hypothetical protein
MSDPKTTELFDTLAKVLLRCGVFGYYVQIESVDYEIQRGGNQMMRVGRRGCWSCRSDQIGITISCD